jgi:hypothetical protein
VQRGSRGRDAAAVGELPQSSQPRNVHDELVAGAVVITGVLLGSLPGRKKVQTPTVDAEALEPAPQR